MKISVTILLGLMLQGLFAQNPVDTSKLYTWVEVMPQFPTCEDVSESSCTQTAWRKFVFSKLSYEIFPNTVKEGIPITLWMEVGEAGSLSNFRVDGTIDITLKQEIISISKTMPKWISGKQNGRTVRCIMKLSVRIKHKETVVQKDTIINSDTTIYIFSEVETTPRFSGCEALAKVEDKDTCASRKMYQFIYSRWRYPALARENDIQGDVTISFVVEKNGSLTNFQIVKDIGGDCGKESIRVAKLMPNWIPGRQNGQIVRTKFTMPLKFKLTK